MVKQAGMVNRPDVADIMELPDGVRKFEWQPDTRFPLCGTFVIHLEDHTIGNILRTQLARDPSVSFVGYRVSHPLEFKMEIRLQTSRDTPHSAMKDALEALRSETQDMQRHFLKSLQRRVMSNDSDTLRTGDFLM